MRMFGNLALRTKLAVVVTVLALPVAVLGGLQFSQQQEAVDFTAKEERGLAYVVEGVIPVLSALNEHAVLSSAVVSGVGDLTARRDEAAARVDAALDGLKRADERYGKSWGTADLVATVEKDWAAIRNGRIAPNAEQLISAHAVVVDGALIPLIFRIGNESGLYLDPDVETLNTIIAMAEGNAQYLALLAETAALSVASIAGDGGSRLVSLALSSRVGEAYRDAQAADAVTKRWLAPAMDHSQRFEEVLRGPLTDATRASESFGALVARVRAGGAGVTVDDLAAGYGADADAHETLFNAANNQLRASFADRKGDARASQLATLAITAVALAVAVVLAIVVARSITGPINRLVEAADRMSLGELDVEFPSSGSAEVGRLAESMGRMQLSMKGAIERLRQRRSAA